MFALKHFGADALSSPELTGDWEYKLKQMEQGRLARDEFMEHINSLTRDLVTRIKNGDIPETAFATVDAPCPKCGGTVQENYRKFQCQKCDFSLWRVLSGREWSAEEMAELLRNRKIGPLTGFRSRMGRPFIATIRLTDENGLEFDFGQERTDASGEIQAPDLSGKDPVGACPKCGSNVFELDMAYACEKALGPSKTCDFRSGKIILQRPIEREQMAKLLREGKTDLLHRFISKKGRPFSAYLAKDGEGKVRFEFAPRVAKPGARAAASRTDADESAAVAKLAAPAARRSKAAAPELPAGSDESSPAPAARPTRRAGKSAATQPAAKKPGKPSARTARAPAASPSEGEDKVTRGKSARVARPAVRKRRPSA
jgi:DNA topoisomerase-3